jgi:biopolymer transport protein ExbD
MKFKRSARDEPEINLIPFIDVLLVVLIFLMLSTTYSKFTEMQVKLPVADTEPHRTMPQEVIVTVTASGAIGINKTMLESRRVDALAAALTLAAGDKAADTVVIINADAAARHQSVIAVMEAARRAGMANITFAAQTTAP